MKTQLNQTVRHVLSAALMAVLASCGTTQHLAYKDYDDVYFTGSDRVANNGQPSGKAIAGQPLAQAAKPANPYGRPVADKEPAIKRDSASADDYYDPNYRANNPSNYQPSRSGNLANNSRMYDRYGNPLNTWEPYCSLGYMPRSGLNVGVGMGNPYSGWGGFYDPYMYGYSPYGYGNWGMPMVNYGFNSGWSVGMGNGFYNPYWGPGFGGYNPYMYDPFMNSNLAWGYPYSGWGRYYGWNSAWGYNQSPVWYANQGGNSNSNAYPTYKGASSAPGAGIMNANQPNVVMYNGNNVGSGGLTTSPTTPTGPRTPVVSQPNNNERLAMDATPATVIDLNANNGNGNRMVPVKNGELAVPVSPNSSYLVRPSSAMIGNGSAAAFPAYTPASANRSGDYYNNGYQQDRSQYRPTFFNDGNSSGGGSRSFGGGSSGGGSVGGASPNIGGGGGAR